MGVSFKKNSLKKVFFLFTPYLYKSSFAKKRLLFTALILVAETAAAIYLPFLAKKIVAGLQENAVLGNLLIFSFLFGSFWILEHIFWDLADICFFPIINEAIRSITYRCSEHLHDALLGSHNYSGAQIISMIKRISLSARSFMKVCFLLLPR